MEQATCALVVVFPSKPFNRVMHNRHLVLRGGETPSKLDVILERLAPTLAPTFGQHMEPLPNTQAMPN
jgi:hypothetical protein